MTKHQDPYEGMLILRERELIIRDDMDAMVREGLAERRINPVTGELEFRGTKLLRDKLDRERRVVRRRKKH
jgi:hypothetical protein